MSGAPDTALIKKAGFNFISLSILNTYPPIRNKCKRSEANDSL